MSTCPRARTPANSIAEPRRVEIAVRTRRSFTLPFVLPYLTLPSRPLKIPHLPDFASAHQFLHCRDHTIGGWLKFNEKHSSTHCQLKNQFPSATTTISRSLAANHNAFPATYENFPGLNTPFIRNPILPRVATKISRENSIGSLFRTQRAHTHAYTNIYTYTSTCISSSSLASSSS